MSLPNNNQVAIVSTNITAPRPPKEKKKKGKTIHRKYICLTYSQCPATPEEMLEHFKRLWPETKLVYILIGQEHHVEEGLHLHCYVELNYKMNVKNMNFFDYVKDEIKYPAKVKEAFSKGNKPGEGKFGWFDYIRKEGFKIIEWGTPPQPATVKKTRKEINEACLKGVKSIRQLILDGDISIKDFQRYRTGVQAFRMTDPIEWDCPKIVKWYYGEKETGKSRKARDECEAAGEYKAWRKVQDKWFDNYTGQEVVWIDEIRAGTFQWEFFLQLIDRYPLDVEIKGGFTRWNPKVIIITSPDRPEEVFYNHQKEQVWDKIGQVTRRITEFRNFNEHPYKGTSPDISEEEVEDIIANMEEENAKAIREHDAAIEIAHPIANRITPLSESMNHMEECSSLTDLELTPTWESKD